MTIHPSAETSVPSSTAPEPGQLVEVRRRQWIVSDVDASAVSPELPKRNLVKLASIDEDALGEEIEVLWELEPGAHVIERAGLPTLSALDDPSKLDELCEKLLANPLIEDFEVEVEASPPAAASSASRPGPS